MHWFQLFLFLHITAAIVAFGPTFTFPLIGAAAKTQPMHIGFALRATEIIEERLVIPFVLSMPFGGLLLASTIGVDWGHNPWLIAALVVYAIAVSFAIRVQAPAVRQAINMVSGGGAPAPVPTGPGAAAAGPPPAFLALMKRIQIGGMMLSVRLLTPMVLLVLLPRGHISPLRAP